MERFCKLTDSIAAAVAALPKKTTPELKQMWRDLFNGEPPCFRRSYMSADWRLKHPVTASAGPLSHPLDGIRRLEDAAAAAIVLFSLVEKQIRLENAATECLIAVGADRDGLGLARSRPSPTSPIST